MVQEHRVTVVPAVPPLARALARHPLVDRYDLSSLRLVSSAPRRARPSSSASAASASAASSASRSA